MVVVRIILVIVPLSIMALNASMNTAQEIAVTMETAMETPENANVIIPIMVVTAPLFYITAPANTALAIN